MRTTRPPVSGTSCRSGARPKSRGSSATPVTLRAHRPVAGLLAHPEDASPAERYRLLHAHERREGPTDAERGVALEGRSRVKREGQPAVDRRSELCDRRLEGGDSRPPVRVSGLEQGRMGKRVVLEVRWYRVEALETVRPRVVHGDLLHRRSGERLFPHVWLELRQRLVVADEGGNGQVSTVLPAVSPKEVR